MSIQVFEGDGTEPVEAWLVIAGVWYGGTGWAGEGPISWWEDASDAPPFPSRQAALDAIALQQIRDIFPHRDGYKVWKC